MTLVLKDIIYHPEVYNALPSLEWAEQKFNERTNGISLIQGELEDLARLNSPTRRPGPIAYILWTDLGIPRGGSCLAVAAPAF